LTAPADEAAALAQQLRSAIADERVLGAIGSIPRERFIGEDQRGRAYDNVALPIDCGQTISQPLVVARMLELLELEPTDRVLDVGTGSGYHAALLGLLVAHVWSIERHPELSERAAQTLGELGIVNVSCVVGDGWEGLPSKAPFEAINIAAAIGELEATALEQQLSLGGRLVAPVGRRSQHLTRVRRTAHGLERETLEAVRFVPLVRDE
jgi:protein-L-isoaspartate(D-aspartate) O-methyltransferase